MSADPMMPHTGAPSARDVAQTVGKAAGAAALGAVLDAAANAAKPGGQTSECKVVVGSIILTALVAGLHALSVIPGPWTLPALAASAAISAGAYALSRGRVKDAALAAAAAAAVTVVNQAPGLLAAQAPPPR
jgi:hypothetical protein